MVDKFTKWIEAKPVKMAESGPVIDFISGVVHRFGVPHSIITDNSTNFTANVVKLWCKNMGIKLDYVLWGLRTTPNRTTGFTPFFMVYGAEAVLPYDIIHAHLVCACTKKEKPSWIGRTVWTP